MRSSLSYICLTLIISLSSLTTLSKVKAPNYDFSMKKFDIFMPGAKIADIEKEYSYKKLVFKSTQFQTYKFFIEHIRYKFAILVQFNNGVVTDFHARLPQYFLHDIFHQSLINRLGKQDIYKKVEEQATYIWKSEKGLEHTYSGACTITCYTIYYAVKKLAHNLRGEYKSILDKQEKNPTK